ncbi:MAG: hypothetical protein BWX71_01717 [Deltaproteobacteria bacterium ADurb.Bin072]|nr:MAG: hypothetical protein BWX71_01717 [Deltaproteobacteria bacterium ADurb.Bin072]
MLMGKAPTSTSRSCRRILFKYFEPVTLQLKSARTHPMKFLRSLTVWNPMRSYSRSASRISKRQGSLRKMSSGGKGIWRKKPASRLAPRRLSSLLTRIRW